MEVVIDAARAHLQTGGRVLDIGCQEGIGNWCLMAGGSWNGGGDIPAHPSAWDRNFAGDSTSTQQNALSGAITVIVQEVLPNGLLRVQGEKTLTLNQGEEFVRLRGYLRAADIDSNNQVSSLRIANAQIAYSGQGTLAEANTPGWLTRFFVGPWMPF